MGILYNLGVFMRISYLFFMSLLYLPMALSVVYESQHLQIGIREVENNSNSSLEIKLDKQIQKVGALNKKRLKKDFLIPFVSIRKNLVDFAQDHYYCPKNAMKIKTNFGKFGIWQDETGIVCILKKKQSEDSIARPINLYKLSNYINSIDDNLTKKFIQICLCLDSKDKFFVKEIK